MHETFHLIKSYFRSLSLLLFIISINGCQIIKPFANDDGGLIDQKIEGYVSFTSGPCVAPCDEHQVIICKNGYMNYYFKAINKPYIKYHGNLDKESNKKFWNLVSELDWLTIKEEYTSDAENVSPKILRILIKDHNLKIIYKHGEPQAVSNIEAFFSSVIKSGRWTEIIDTKKEAENQD